MTMIASAIQTFEGVPVPDAVTRPVIRWLVGRTSRQLSGADGSISPDFLREMSQAPIARHTDRANEQHYEVPPAFFRTVLGKHLKYSGCYWPAGVRTLDEAEEASLRVTCERAELTDGQVLQRHLLKDLVETPLQEGTVNIHDRPQSHLGLTGGEGDRMRLADARVEKSPSTSSICASRYRPFQSTRSACPIATMSVRV